MCCWKHRRCLSVRYLCLNLSGMYLETEIELHDITSLLTRMVPPVSLPAGVCTNFYCFISPSTQLLSPSCKRKNKMCIFSALCTKDRVSFQWHPLLLLFGYLGEKSAAGCFTLTHQKSPRPCFKTWYPCLKCSFLLKGLEPNWHY